MTYLMPFKTLDATAPLCKRNTNKWSTDADGHAWHSLDHAHQPPHCRLDTVTQLDAKCDINRRQLPLTVVDGSWPCLVAIMFGNVGHTVVKFSNSSLERCSREKYSYCWR